MESPPGVCALAGSETILEVREGEPLTVECALRIEQRAEWRLSGAAPPADMSPAEERPVGAGAGAGAGGMVARLRAASARPHHAGLYTCSDDGSGAAVRVRVLPARSARPAEHAQPARTGTARRRTVTSSAQCAQLPPSSLYSSVLLCSLFS